MKKRYIIRESQYKALIERKKTRKVVDQILEDIERCKYRLNENTLIQEAILDTIKKYFRKGVLTTAVLSSLLANNVKANDLISAGVPQEKVEQAQQQTDIDLPKVEKKLLNILAKRNQQNMIDAYNSLGEDEKLQALEYIATKIDKVGQMNDFDYSLLFGKHTVDSDIHGKIGQDTDQITVVVADSVLSMDLTSFYGDNNWEINNPEQLRESVKELLNMMHEVNQIRIVSSSSTLRNTGEAEGMTWVELSKARAEAAQQAIIGIQHNFGGCGSNESHQVSEDIIQLHYEGENGDGTSGPPSFAEKDAKMVQWYQENNIDPKLWQSAGQGEPIARENKGEYDKYKHVTIEVSGKIVVNDVENVVTHKYIKMTKKVKIKKITPQRQKAKVNSCPITFRN